MYYDDDDAMMIYNVGELRAMANDSNLKSRCFLLSRFPIRIHTHPRVSHQDLISYVDAGRNLRNV
jgi:hypothetical protein